MRINATDNSNAPSRPPAGSPQPARSARKRRRIFATITVGIVLVAAACVAPSPESPEKGSDRLVLETAFKNIDLRHATETSTRMVSLAGLKAISEADTLLEIDAQAAAIALTYEDRLLGEWPIPGENDHDGWAAVVADVLEKARSEAPKLAEQDHELVLARFFRGALSKLDRYTRYATPGKARNTRARREGFGGLGVTIRYDKGNIFVEKVHPGTPAFKAKLKPRDLITHVGGIMLTGLTQSAAIGHLRGPVHSKADLTIVRKDAPAPLKIPVVRAHIILPTVTSTREDGILTIRLSGFNQGTSRSLGKVLAAAERENADTLRGIVLDLRSNPGGLLDQAVAVADFFLNDGRIISTKGRHHRANQIFNASWGERVTSTPIAVLVNGRSASASEIVAAALRDRGRAIVIGTSSFGKGSVQTIIRLPNGGELTLTWAHMIAPAGFNLQSHGIIPAICTSAADDELSNMMAAIRSDVPAAGTILNAALASRYAIRTNPDLARERCPPTRTERAEDQEIAKYLLEHKSLYTRALRDGSAAIAER
ncbi:MAG: carboxyl-terminal processing protease [Paracoccaceae bacterium]|jgi:carboxyl-terminal processing protease